MATHITDGGARCRSAVERWAVAEEGRSLNQAWLDSAMGQVGPPYFEQIGALFGNRVTHEVIT